MTVDHLPWHFVDASGQTLIVVGLKPGRHRILIALADPMNRSLPRRRSSSSSRTQIEELHNSQGDRSVQLSPYRKAVSSLRPRSPHERPSLFPRRGPLSANRTVGRSPYRSRTFSCETPSPPALFNQRKACSCRPSRPPRNSTLGVPSWPLTSRLR
ncbi:DUF6130 family protein [Rhizobium grahamii]|uniref:DUF6130 family protein n=1 Tax=Rhizobium grahamii TaxID=1120045 RepID=UPI001FCA7670|nr:DUF6130 family protein [Rhizobium grahamii]